MCGAICVWHDKKGSCGPPCSGDASPFFFRPNGSDGDAVLFYPDFRGGAEIAIRLFPSFQGKGIGSRTLKLLVELASLMGFSNLYARVDGRNLRSLALMDKLFERVGADECGVVRFSKDLEG